MEKGSDKRDELTTKQKQALPYFIATASVTKACERACITPACYYNWMKDGVFARALEKEREQLRFESYTILRANLPRAAETLIELLNSGNEVVRRLAAKDILDHVHTYIETKSIDERIKLLEERSNEKL